MIKAFLILFSPTFISCLEDATAQDGCDEMSLLQTTVLQDTLLTVMSRHAVDHSSKQTGRVPPDAVLSYREVLVNTSSQNPSSVETHVETKKVLLTDPHTLASSDIVVALFVFSVTSAFAYLFISGAGVLGMPDSDVARKLTAELCGTFVLVFTVSCCCIAGSADWNPTAIAAVLMAMIYATGAVSGGNLNPAVSVALCLCGKMTLEMALQYCAAQILGGLLAALTASLTIAPLPAAVGAVAPYGWGFAVLAEVIYTTILCFVVLNCAASKRNNPDDVSNQFFGLAIGFVVIAGGYPCGNISGAHFNPAVSLGLEMVTGAGLGWGFVWATFQCVASAFAVLLFRLARPEEFYETAEVGSHFTLFFAEFLGTFVLVLTVGLNMVTDSGATAWSACAALISMIYSLGDISGAHLNPAVSIAVSVADRSLTAWTRLVLYIPAQMFGAFCAGIVYATFHIAGPQAAIAYPLAAGKSFTPITAGIGEMLFTLLLAYVVLATTMKSARQKSRNHYFGLCIGACVMVGGIALGKVSGGVLNPAVSFGVLCSNDLFGRLVPEHAQHQGYERLWFPAFQAIGGAFASLIFILVHIDEYGDAEKPEPRVVCKCLAEFLGTFYLVLTVGFVSLGGSDTWNPLAIALVLVVMVYSTASVSGANLNPAVSLTLAFCKKLDLGTTGLYWLMQISGGIAAGFVFCFLFNDGVTVGPHAKMQTTVQEFARDGSAYTAVISVPGYSWDLCVFAEVLYTTMLCFVVVQSAVSKGNNPEDDGNQFFALAIGFVIVAGGYAVGSISGACFNPAVSLGLSVSREAFIGSPSMLTWGFVWSGFQLVGSVIAALLFAVMRPQDVGLDAADSSGQEQKVTLMVKCLSEFLGVFILVMTVGLNVVTKSPATALSAAGALMSSIYSLGYISGAHFNPAVTLAVVLSGRDKCDPFVGVLYVLSHIMAAVLAGHLYAGFHIFGPNKTESFTLWPCTGYGFAAAGVAEMFFTSVLAYVVLAVATSSTLDSSILKKTKQCFFFGLAIAACVVAGGFAIGSISGGELNPAVSLGISVASLAHIDPHEGHQFPLASFVPFSLWELSGGIIASIVFRCTHGNEFTAELKAT